MKKSRYYSCSLGWNFKLLIQFSPAWFYDSLNSCFISRIWIVMWNHLHLSKLSEVIVFDYVILLWQWQVACDVITLKQILWRLNMKVIGTHRIANLANIKSPRLSWESVKYHHSLCITIMLTQFRCNFCKTAKICISHIWWLNNTCISLEFI